MNEANQKLFEENILNREFIISYAIDHGDIRTSVYKGFKFILFKNDYYHGPLKATKDGQVYEGTWRANEDYGKLTISLPGYPEEFKFLTRDWRFLSKKIPVLKLSPWGEDESIIIHLTRK